MTDRQRNVFAGCATLVVIALLSFPVTTLHASGAGDLTAPNVVKQTNDLRTTRGLGSLTLNALLMRAAQAKADDMAARGYFAHRTPDGRLPWDWIAESGYEFVTAAENLAVGYPSDADLIAAWMESEGHRHNLLNQSFTDIGIGIARGRYKGEETVFVVQMFARPRAGVRRAALEAAPIRVDLLLPPGVTLESTSLPISLPELPCAVTPATWETPTVPPAI